MIGSFKRRVIIFLLVVVDVVTAPFMKKRTRLVVFSQAKDRYSGNSRILFEYLAEKKWKVLWLVSSEEQIKKIPVRFRSNVKYMRSKEGLYALLTARAAVISHGSGDFGLGWYLVRNKLVVNLWHGTGIKNLGILDEKITEIGAERYLKKETRYWDIMTVSSSIYRYATASAHGLDIRKVYVTGDPRVDNMIAKGEDASSKGTKFKVLYAPTFRDYELESSLFFPFDDFCEDNLSKYFEINPQIQFYLRPHPNDKDSIQQASLLSGAFPSNVYLFSSAECDDIDEFIHEFDLIVSDYSSIHFEPLLIDTPCVFIPLDLTRYSKERGFAFPYELVTPGPKVLTCHELFASITDALHGACHWKEHREFVREMFFEKADGNSNFRIAKLIEERLNS